MKKTVIILVALIIAKSSFAQKVDTVYITDSTKDYVLQLSKQEYETLQNLLKEAAEYEKIHAIETMQTFLNSNLKAIKPKKVESK